MTLSLDDAVRVGVSGILPNPVVLVPHMPEKIVAHPGNVVPSARRLIDWNPNADDVVRIQHARRNDLEHTLSAPLFDAAVYRDLIRVWHHHTLIEVKDLRVRFARIEQSSLKATKW